MSETRTITHVIRACLKVVPVTEAILREDLASLHSSCSYTAPEAMGRRWGELARVLEVHTAKHFEPSPGPGKPPTTTLVPWVAACQRIVNGTDPAEWYLDMADAE